MEHSVKNASRRSANQVENSDSSEKAGPVFVSVAIPSHNSEKIIEKTCAAVIAALEKDFSGIAGFSWEIIIADDGSTDSTWETVKKLHSADKRIKGVKLFRNIGQQKATIAALLFAGGEWIVTMDDDLSHDPGFIRSLYDKASSGYDIVFASPAKIDMKPSGNDKLHCRQPEKFSLISLSLRKAGSLARDLFFLLFAGKPIGKKISSYRIMTKKLKEKITGTRRRKIYISATALKTGARAGYIETIPVCAASGPGSRYTVASLFRLYIMLVFCYSLPEPLYLFFAAITGRKQAGNYLLESKAIEEILL